MPAIPNNILNILDSCNVDGNTVRMNCGQLDRKTYEAVNKVLEALGGKWDRRAKGHVFADDPAVNLEAAILTGEYSNKKADFGFFETPPELAARVVELADIQPRQSILEPSAGTGALLQAIRVAPVYITVNDIQDKNIEILCSHGFTDCTEHGRDFLQVDPDDPDGLGRFDRVIMNPPFSVPGVVQYDIDHVTHAYKFLKPGGRLVSIMSAGTIFRENSKAKIFRDKLLHPCGFYEDNPDGAFKSSGTMVRTITVVLNK